MPVASAVLFSDPAILQSVRWPNKTQTSSIVTVELNFGLDHAFTLIAYTILAICTTFGLIFTGTKLFGAKWGIAFTILLLARSRWRLVAIAANVQHNAVAAIV